MGRTDDDVRLREVARDIAYHPLPSQQKFHDSEARFKGFSGPIGSGKSQALCQEAIRLSYLNQGRLGLLGAPTYPMLRDATQAALFEILDGNKIPFEHNKAENTLIMRDTGSKILFRPVDEFERLRGTNLAWFGLDELTYTQEEAWLRLEGRLRDPKAKRLCGFAAWTPKGYDWVYRKFMAKPVKGYEAIVAKPRENRHLLQQIPDYYERLKDSYDERFYQQEVLGAYLNLDAALVYASFARNENLADLSLDPRLPLLWALDFNVDPMSSVVVQLVRGKVRVLDEIVLRHATTHEACEEFLKRFPKSPAGDGGLRRRFGVPATDDGGFGLRDDPGVLPGALHHAGDVQGAEVESERAGTDQSDEREAAVGGRRHRAAGGLQVQGTDQGFRAGVLSRPTPARSTRTGTG